eukprot:SAG11_NODE_8914_length_963_cov_1.089120_1_plen_256_part_10
MIVTKKIRFAVHAVWPRPPYDLLYRDFPAVLLSHAALLLLLSSARVCAAALSTSSAGSIGPTLSLTLYDSAVSASQGNNENAGMSPNAALLTLPAGLAAAAKLCDSTLLLEGTFCRTETPPSLSSWSHCDGLQIDKCHEWSGKAEPFIADGAIIEPEAWSWSQHEPGAMQANVSPSTALDGGLVIFVGERRTVVQTPTLKTDDAVFSFPTTIGGAISDWTLATGAEMEVWSHTVSTAAGQQYGGYLDHFWSAGAFL